MISALTEVSDTNYYSQKLTLTLNTTKQLRITSQHSAEMFAPCFTSPLNLHLCKIYTALILLLSTIFFAKQNWISMQVGQAVLD